MYNLIEDYKEDCNHHKTLGSYHVKKCKDDDSQQINRSNGILVMLSQQCWFFIAIILLKLSSGKLSKWKYWRNENLCQGGLELLTSICSLIKIKEQTSGNGRENWLTIREKNLFDL